MAPPHTVPFLLHTNVADVEVDEGDDEAVDDVAGRLDVPRVP